MCSCDISTASLLLLAHDLGFVVKVLEKKKSINPILQIEIRRRSVKACTFSQRADNHHHDGLYLSLGFEILIKPANKELSLDMLSLLCSTIVLPGLS